MRSKLLRLLLLLVVVFLLLVAASAASNLFLPERSEEVTHLSEPEKARLAEAINLRERQGNAVWPGFGDEAIPIVVYNEGYAFLVNFDGEPPAGWVLPRSGERQGTAWEMVAGDRFFDEPYYRQRLVGDVTPQAFTVRIGEQWAASMPTSEWSRIKLVQIIRADMPSWLRPLIPYSLVTRLFLGDSDKYISLISHESFHAFVGIRSERHLVQAEEAAMLQAEQYPWSDEVHIAAWQRELDLLTSALGAGDRPDTVELVRQFLDARDDRRTNARLATRFIDYEQRREWLEGLAKYVELEAWHQGATARDYVPHPATASLSDFNGYSGYERAWKREVDQISRVTNQAGDPLFYYSGMAQAVLLDRLQPGWKEGALTGGTTLEGLLDAAVNHR
jgi:hypothetical protein